MACSFVAARPNRRWRILVQQKGHGMGSSTGGRRDDIDPEHLTALQEGRVSRRAPLPKHSPSTMAFCWPMSCRRPERNFVQPSRMRSRWESSSVCNGSGRRFGILTRSWNSWLTWPHIDRTPFVDGPVSLWPVIRGSDRRHCWNASNPSLTIPILPSGNGPGWLLVPRW